MSLLHNIKDCINRYRHGKGYGVHSPFAYHFITTIADCRYEYYGYEIIDDCNPDKHLRKMARLLLRLTARLNPKEAFLAVKETADRSVLETAVTEGNSQISFIKSPFKSATTADCRRLIYIDSPTGETDFIKASVKSDLSAIVFDNLSDKDVRKVYDLTIASLPPSMILESRNAAIIVVNSNLSESVKHIIRL